MMPGLRPRIRVRRWRQRGYNLVILMVMFSVMSILMAKALPQWSTRIQREQEKELIFRGLQYAEAIRVFQARFNRVPIRLQELVETEPRCIRQLWNNPLDPESQGQPPQAIGWEPIIQGVPDTPNQQQQQQQQGQQGGDAAGSFGFGNDDEEEVRTGPIIGVRSKISEDSFRIFLDGESTGDWRFTQDLFQPRPTASSGGTALPPHSDEIGKPWPAGITPQIGQPPTATPGTNLSQPDDGGDRGGPEN